MPILRKALLIALVLNLVGCAVVRVQRAKRLMAEANQLLEEDLKLEEKWVAEYGKAFRLENRNLFPSNREDLRISGEKVTEVINESMRLNSQAAEKIDQAVTLFSDDKVRRGLAKLAASVRTQQEINNLFKEQMLLVSDAEIKDPKTFNEKFLRVAALIGTKRTEVDDQKADAKKLLGF